MPRWRSCTCACVQAKVDAVKREKLLELSQRLFETEGYPATTMEAVAIEAGVALKTVYVAFETKSLVSGGVLMVGDTAAMIAARARAAKSGVPVRGIPGAGRRRVERGQHLAQHR